MSLKDVPLSRCLQVIACLLLVGSCVLNIRASTVEAQAAVPRATIVETLISVDDPNFGTYDVRTGNGAIGRVTDKNGVKYFESLITEPTEPHPPDEYVFRFLTGLPVVNTSRHWMLYFKHTIENIGEVTIENCAMDGWHAYIIATDGNLWRLFKYERSGPSTIKPGEKVVATNSYQIHYIPDYRATFYFTFNSGDSSLDSWQIGREILRFSGVHYQLPLMSLLRLSPGKIELTPQRTIDYLFNVTNVKDETIELSVDHKFAETVSWVLQLWPSAYKGRVGSDEVTLQPMNMWSKRMTETYPKDKSDHAVHVYFGVVITSGEDAPPLKGEIWEDLYGVNSYLGLKEASARLLTKDKPTLETTFLLTPYVSPSSQDVKPYDYNFTITVFDSNYQEIIYGPVTKFVDQPIRKGYDLKVQHRIPTTALNNKEGKYMIVIDTIRLGTGKTDAIHLARISLPFWLALPDVAVYPDRIRVQDVPQIGRENKIVVEISNSGRMDARNVSVEVYIDDALIQSKRVDIAADSSTIADFVWTPKRNEQTIEIKLDPKGILTESETKNNYARKTFTVGSLDGEVPSENIYLVAVVILACAVVVVAFLMRKRSRIKFGEVKQIHSSDKKAESASAKEG